LPPFRHIVIGLDLHPRTGRLTSGGRAAIAHARWLASGESIHCTLVHSTANDEFWDPAEHEYEATRRGEAPREALEEALAELTGAGISAELEVTEERPWLAITQLVVDAPADLVLVGKRTEEDRDGPRVGSVAVTLLHNCPCAVWVARPGVEPPPRRVLAATDLTPVGDRVLERASQVCDRSGAELHVVHSFQFTMAAQLEANEKGYIERVGRESTEAIRESLARVSYTGKLEIHVGLTTPTRAILECVKRLQPDLVVMATISRGGIGGLLLGNTAERLVQRLDTSLLTVKPAEFVSPVKPTG